MNFKNTLVGLFCSLMVVGCAGGVGDGCCGWSSRENTAMGQVKMVRHVTPVLCPDYATVDISLGVMQNGVGSMSIQDMWFYIPENMVPEMKKLAELGALVTVTYDSRRLNWCVPIDRITSYKTSK